MFQNAKACATCSFSPHPHTLACLISRVPMAASIGKALLPISLARAACQTPATELRRDQNLRTGQ